MMCALLPTIAETQRAHWFSGRSRIAWKKADMVATPPILRDVQATLTFAVNGNQVTVETSAAKRLSGVLRDNLGLTGTKVGCDAGDCGACTVLLDGEPVCACLVPAAQAEGREITTVEGLAKRPPLFDRLQRSFLFHGAA